MPWVIIQYNQSISYVATKLGRKAIDVWNDPKNSEVLSNGGIESRTQALKAPVRIWMPPLNPIQQTGAVGQTLRLKITTDDQVCCPWCEKPLESCDLAWDQVRGSNIGNGGTLQSNIWPEGIDKHPWYTEGGSLEAHHILVSESVNNNDWKVFCKEFGYNINRRENGVQLPSIIYLACQLGVPLHRGPHGHTRPRYDRYVFGKMREVSDEIEGGDYCTPTGCADLRKRLDLLSQEILDEIASFDRPISFEGKQYDPSLKTGCCNVTSVSSMPESAHPVCTEGRDHGFTGLQDLHQRERARVALKAADEHRNDITKGNT